MSSLARFWGFSAVCTLILFSAMILERKFEVLLAGACMWWIQVLT